ncbi:Hpt domain-containing protein [Desulfobotulus alkaliphilus]|uniref:Hpt domain-containing protein n=1 Tax=Desulfobotulus alkaliphilus TaxID=622671 RepID=A0A562RI50_9BACT|nr:Hpt domain-containing protein [Desulfobotulus alkaliphilus]TWI68593.1 Hpt domain-containing protein [Desulfobotulus alkaliphilus]
MDKTSQNKYFSSVFDKKTMMNRFMNDAEIACGVVRVFLTDTPRQLSLLQDALKDKDLETATRIAHSIKGAAMNVGGLSLAKLAAAMEKDGHEKHIPAMEEKLGQMKKNCHDLIGILQETFHIKDIP